MCYLYVFVQSVVQTSDSSYDKLQRQNEMLQAQVADLLEQVRSKGDADDEIMVQVNDKVEQWKVSLWTGSRLLFGHRNALL